MRTILAGSRTLGRALAECPFTSEISEVVSGRAHGIDEAGEGWARQNGHLVTLFPAGWDRYGRSAGFRRNIQMANYSEALIAVHDGESRGTAQMIEEAKRRGLRVFVWTAPAP